MEIQVRCWNIQGLPKTKSAGKRQLKMRTINSLFQDAPEFTFLALQETKLHTNSEKQKVFADFGISPYLATGDWSFSWAPCRKQGADARSYSGGVILFWRTSKLIRQISPPIQDMTHASCYAFAIITLPSHRILVASVYLRSKYELEVSKQLQEQIKILTEQENITDLILAGDFNYHSPRPPVYTQALDPLSQIIGKEVAHQNSVLIPTYPNNRVLDYIASSLPQSRLQDVQEPEPGYSDHYVLKTRIRLTDPWNEGRVRGEHSQEVKKQEQELEEVSKINNNLQILFSVYWLMANWAAAEICKKKKKKIGRNMLFFRSIAPWVVL